MGCQGMQTESAHVSSLNLVGLPDCQLLVDMHSDCLHGSHQLPVNKLLVLICILYSLLTYWLAVTGEPLGCLSASRYLWTGVDT